MYDMSKIMLIRDKKPNLRDIRDIALRKCQPQQDIPLVCVFFCTKKQAIAVNKKRIYTLTTSN